MMKMKDDRAGGRKEKEGRILERVCGREMEEIRGGTMNTKG